MTVEQALAHPTWAMGGKITIDSATLMNKGLELIEAHHLFGVPYDRIDVVVHPQSIVHSLIHLCDGATLAHLGYPDMRVPISYALHHPERVDVPVPTARPGRAWARSPSRRVDLEAFPCLRLAREAGERRRHRALRAQRRQRGRRARLPRRPPAFLGIAEVIERDARPAAARRASTRSSRSTSADRAGARVGAPSCVGARARDAPHELGVLDLRRLRRADHPARVGHFAAAKAVGHAGRALLAVLPAAARSRSAAGETEYGIGAIPLGGYVRITGHEPQRGDRRPRSSRAPTTASRCGSGSS